MIASPTISGYVPVLLITKRYVDERGWFSEAFREDRLWGLGVHYRFVQDNQSYSKRVGTLRGLHFQNPPAAQAKLISVIGGHILDVAVDLRNGSPTYGKYISVELSAEQGQQLYIPPGFAHGFLSLSDGVTISYKVSSFYAPELDRGIRWDDPEIDFPWPLSESEAILSRKDRDLPFLKDLESPFDYDGEPLGRLQIVDFGQL